MSLNEDLINHFYQDNLQNCFTIIMEEKQIHLDLNLNELYSVLQYVGLLALKLKRNDVILRINDLSNQIEDYYKSRNINMDEIHFRIYRNSISLFIKKKYFKCYNLQKKIKLDCLPDEIKTTFLNQKANMLFKILRRVLFLMMILTSLLSYCKPFLVSSPNLIYQSIHTSLLIFIFYILYKMTKMKSFTEIFKFDN